MPRRPSPPKYTRHSSGQARVRIGGIVHYLGAFGSPESCQKYARLIGGWQSRQSDPPRNLTVGHLSILYAQHAESYYVKNGTPTGHLHIVRNGLKYLNQAYRTLPVAEFDAKKLTVLRSDLIARGFARAYINDLVSIVKRMFKWAVPEKLAPVNVHHELTTVGTLKAGRSAAREPEPVRAVPDARIDALRPHVPPAVWAMIQLQRLTGMRPGEVLILRGCDLNTTGDVWEYTPSRHKLEHKRIQRVVMIGPAAQAVLRPFLKTDLQAYLSGARLNRFMIWVSRARVTCPSRAKSA